MKKYYALLLLTSCAFTSYAQLAQQEVMQQLQEASGEMEQGSAASDEHRVQLTREEFNSEVNEQRKILTQLKQRVHDDKSHYERVAKGLKEVYTDQLVKEIADDVNALYAKYVPVITSALRDKLSPEDAQKLSEFITLFKDCQVLKFKPNASRTELVKASIVFSILANAYLSATPEGDDEQAGAVLNKPFELNYVNLLELLDKQVEILKQKA